MSCPKCGSSDKHFCPPSLGEPGFYLCECPAPASSALAEAAREVLAYRETAKEANRVHIEMHNQITALQAEVARLRSKVERLKAELVAGASCNRGLLQTMENARKNSDRRIELLEAELVLLHDAGEQGRYAGAEAALRYCWVEDYTEDDIQRGLQAINQQASAHPGDCEPSNQEPERP